MKNYFLDRAGGMDSLWRDKYETLKDYYTAEYGQTYQILDRVTLVPTGTQKFPCYTLEQGELEIDPDEDMEEFTIQETDSIQLRQMKKQRQRLEIQKCIASFPYFCHRFVKIVHPTRGLVPFVLYNYQRRIVKEYEEYRFNIISKMRQAGLTTVTALWGLWRCMFKKTQIITVMSKTDREAMTSANMIGTALSWLPTWIRPAMAKDNDHEKKFIATGSKIDFQGPNAARSKSLTYMILDEAAHIPEMETHWKGMFPTLSAGGNCIAISTVNGLGNWYQQTFYDAMAKKNKFHIIELDFWEHPDYNDPEWVADQKAQLGDEGWDQEVMRSFLGIGETYIPGKVISEIEKKIKDSPNEGYPLRIRFPEWANEKESFFPEKGALWIYKEPVDGHDYIMGVDPADGTGSAGDNSCFQILDTITMEQVCEFYSNKVPPHVFSQIINEVAIYYNQALVVVENMAPAGGAVMAGLKDTMMYENLYHDLRTKKGRGTPGIKTNQTIRSMVLEALQRRVLRHAIRINSPRVIYELNTFKYNPSRKRAEADKGRHDDAIMALSIAIFIRDEEMKDVPVGAEVPREIMDVFKSEIYEQIKTELKDGAPEDWIEEEPDLLSIYSEDVTPGVVFNTRRRFDKVLREFGW